jgi:hypothetical protein
VENILKQVESMSPEERGELWACVRELWRRVGAEEAKNLDDWEKQVQRDSNAGKLDQLLAELQEDIEAGRVKPLEEVISERGFC